MGESEDEPSNAAQSAQGVEARRKQPGLLGRIIDAFSASDHDDEADGTTDGRVDDRRRSGLLSLQHMPLEDVAVPRAEIVAVPVDIGKDDLIQTFRSRGLTRLPVYEGTLDSPIGMVHLKDLALTYGFNGGGHDFALRPLLRPLIFAPPSMSVGVMLQKMQAERMHMALVIDEYGGIDGLVTIEDLIEQVIGEIVDEHDLDEGVCWVLDKPGEYLAQSRTPLDLFKEETGLDLSLGDEEEEVDTLGGLVFLLRGNVPAVGDVVPHPSGAEFVIVEADSRRIERVRVRMPEVVQADANAAQIKADQIADAMADGAAADDLAELDAALSDTNRKKGEGMDAGG